MFDGIERMVLVMKRAGARDSLAGREHGVRCGGHPAWY